MTSSEALAQRAVDLLARLVAFDTTSRNSNLALIEWVEAYLADLGVETRRVPNPDGSKSNLTATIGPRVDGGVVLSGHTDVVPVDGQPWVTDPWTLTEKDGRLYGRGTCDMKGFLALALAAAPELAKAPLKRPVHLAFSYDEEIGCLGAPDMIAVIARDFPKVSAVVVGEPTDMQAVRGHKGIASWRVTVTGHEAHSSLPTHGLSANMQAIKLMNMLVELSEKLVAEADPASPFAPPYPTLTIGTVNGGTALNILARECVFVFDLRSAPPTDPKGLLADFFAEAARMDAEMKTRFPECGVRVETRSLTPGFAPVEDGPAETLARAMAGDNGPPRVVSYAAEAGQFQGAGFSVVICGPGSIEQAHQPNEYVEVSQIERGAAFMTRLVEELQH